MREVYFDHAATTPLLPKVVEAMLPYLKEHWGNPLSLHRFGDRPREAMEKARAQVADLIGAQPREIYFTASGSEANNMAIKGAALMSQKKGKHIVVSAIEHHSVLNSAKTLEKLGFEVTVVPVDEHGLVNPDDIAAAIREDTTLVSVMHANNEIGTIEPIVEIAQALKERSTTRHLPYIHTDAVAAAGILPVDVKELGVDLLSLAGNQFYGPQGAGALFIRKGVRVMPLIDGGIQEGGRRAGTENVAAIVGLGAAAELAKAEREDWARHLIPLRDRLIERLTTEIDHVYLTGHPTLRLPGHVSICVEFIEGESMLLFLNTQGVAVSSGSTCTSRALKASHVLTAIGMPAALAQGSLVFTIGKDNTMEDVDYVMDVLPPIVQRLRQMSPLYKGG